MPRRRRGRGRQRGGLRECLDVAHGKPACWLHPSHVLAAFRPDDAGVVRRRVRVAVITHHSGLPALQCTGRIEELVIADIYCAGDLVNYGPHPHGTHLI